METDDSGGVTVRPVVEETPALCAIMLAVPAAIAVASPEVPIVATPVLEELQETEEVISKILLSLKVPFAMY
jgi:hypothetical protein